MSAKFDITQNTLPAGLGPGNAREDGVPGELVTITIQDPSVTEVLVELEWTPPDDEVAFFNLTQNPANILEWTFTPDSNAINASGSYMIRAVTDASNPARRDEAELTFSIKTPNSGLVIPALNEPGNPLASLVRPDSPGAANNVPFLGPGRNVPGSPIANINFAAWWKSLADLILVVDGFGGGAGEVNTGVDVGTGVGISDGANVGVQLPLRSFAGINDVGVALNGQTVEVDGSLLLDLTAVRHVAGPAPLTLEYAADPTIQLHNNAFAADIDKRWGIQSQDPDGSPLLLIGAVDTDGGSLNFDGSGLTMSRFSGTGKINLTQVIGDTVRIRSAQDSGGGTVLIRPDGVVSDEYPLLTMQSNGAFGAAVEWHVGDRSPVGNITGNPGDIYVRTRDGATSTFYQHNGAAADNTSWVDIGAASIGLQSAYDAVPSILLAGNTAVSVTVPLGHTAAALDINLDSTFTPVTAGDGAVLFRDDGTARMLLGEHPIFGFGLFADGESNDLTLATDFGGSMTLLTQGNGVFSAVAGGAGDATFGSVGGDAFVQADAGDVNVVANQAFTLDVGAQAGVLSVTAAGVTTLQGGGGLGSLVFSATGATTITSPLALSMTSAAGGVSLTATTGLLDLLSVDPAGDISIVSAQADLTLIASLGTTLLQGSTLNLASNPGAFSLTVNSNQVMDVTAAGAITLLGVSAQAVSVTTQGTGNLALGASGTGDVNVSAAGGDIDLTADTDLTMTATSGLFSLTVASTAILSATAAGVTTLSSALNQNLSILATGTGDIVINPGTGDITLTGVLSATAAGVTTLQGGVGGATSTIIMDAAGGIDLLTDSNQDATITAEGTGNILLDATGDDITLTSLNLGFYGATAAPKPTITGSRAGNAALADLLTELATLGLITDSST